ncbi:MAG: hypothetical protein ACMV1K_13460 [Sulfurospirillum sp.]
MRNSLAKRKKIAITSKNATKIRHEHLHLVRGEQQVNHSHSPIPASDIEKLYAINPKYVDELFSIMKESVEIEKQETNNFYSAIEREQANDKLAIEKDAKNKAEAIRLIIFVVIFLMISGSAFVYFGYEVIGGAIVTTVLLGIIKAFFTDSNKKKEPKKI